jgi:methylaspartate mutase epsilon subunit
MDVQNKRLTEQEFNQIRSEVLMQWHTGKEVNLQESFEYHKRMDKSRSFPHC